MSASSRKKDCLNNIYMVYHNFLILSSHRYRLVTAYFILLCCTLINKWTLLGTNAFCVVQIRLRKDLLHSLVLKGSSFQEGDVIPQSRALYFSVFNSDYIRLFVV